MAENSHTTSPSIIAVPFQNDTLIAIEREDGIYIAIRPICERLGLNWSGQFLRIKRHAILSEAVCMTQTPFTRHGQEETCLKLDYLNGWLMGIDASRVKPAVRDALIEYQRECHRVLFEHFFRKTKARGASDAARAQRAALAERQARVNEMQAATSMLETIRRSVGPRAAALAAPKIYAPFGIVIDLESSDTLAQAVLPFGELH